jgi:nitronate monooxygenase
MRAPVAGAATARLAGEVSRAGGLGSGRVATSACGGWDRRTASAGAALAAGAVAVVMGTRFVASEESDAHPRYKARLLQAEARDTTLTELFDVGWPASPHRVLRNSTYERWEAAGRPQAGERPEEGHDVASGIPRYAANVPLLGMEGDVEAMAMYAGQSVGAITEVEPAAAIIERFAAALRNG